MEWLRKVDGAARSLVVFSAPGAAGAVVSVSPVIVVWISGGLSSVSGAGSAARAHILKIMTGRGRRFGAPGL